MYEQLHAAWEKESLGDEDEVLREIDAMLDAMRENTAANTLLLEEDEEDGED